MIRSAIHYFANTLLMAVDALLRWPLRASLTAFGILIGVAAVVITVALGEGTRARVASQISNLGSNALVVQAERRPRSGAITDETIAALTEADGEAISDEVDAVQYVAPTLESREQVIYFDSNLNIELVGTTLDFFAIRAWRLKSGVLWTESAQNTGERVCVIGQTVAEEVFGGADPVGSVVRLGAYPFRVVGLLDAKGQDSFGRDEDSRVIVPIKAMRGRLAPMPHGWVDSLLLSAKSEALSEPARKASERLLRQRHGLLEGMENDFRIRSQAEFKAVQDRVFDVLNLLLVSIAIVSLVVGGVGIMNIMLVSISERTKEIGIRLAVGARERDILWQFLVEAVLLSLIGGVLGTVVAVVSVEFLASALSLPMAVSVPALLAALGVSTVTGMTFGFLPARRAAQLDPIDALRAE
jgi:putative ABC transport system permease protein